MAKNRLDFESHLSRHPHDITGGFTSSLTTGCLVPQYWHILNPGDSIYYNTKMFIRFKDVVTAFLGEVDVHLDYYFVPLQMLYLPFGQIFAQTNDLISSNFNSLSSTDKFPLLANLPHIDPSTSDLNLGVFTNPEGYYSGHYECIGKELTRLIEPLGFNPLAACANPSNPETGIASSYCLNPLSAPWSFAAYQAIYQNFYRNDEFEKFNIQSYNFDQYFTDTSFMNVEFTKLRYVQRPSDYFTSVRVSPIASGVNRLGNDAGAGSATLGDLLNKTRQFIGGDAFDPSNAEGNNSSIPSFNAVTVMNENANYPTASNIRALFAVDKFMRVYGRAGKTYDDQILAHFGVKVPHDVKHQATKLASYHTAIGSDPVYATSTTGVDTGSVLGQVGGQASGEIKVVGGQNGERGKYAEKFTAPVHGVFMCVVYAVTKPRYTMTFNKLNLLTDRLSFPIPEYDKLGAQPLYLFESNPLSLGSSQANYGVRRIGWQNRYQEFKKKYNRASLNYLHDTGLLGSENNSFSAWVLSRSPFKDLAINLTADALVLDSWLFERPDALNSVMSVQYDGTWHDEYFVHPHEILDTDPMITEFQCEAKLVSWMSETGEPDLGM